MESPGLEDPEDEAEESVAVEKGNSPLADEGEGETLESIGFEELDDESGLDERPILGERSEEPELVEEPEQTQEKDEVSTRIENITFEDAPDPDEPTTKVPSFLADPSVTGLPRPLTLSEQDAARAVKALAAARGMAENNQLLKRSTPAEMADPVAIDLREETEVVKDEVEVDDGEPPVLEAGDTGTELDSIPEEPFEPAGNMPNRIIEFANLILREWRAKDVVVFDLDGYVLFSNHDSPGKIAQEANTLLKAMSVVSKAAAIQANHIFQTSDGNGAWHCYIPGEGPCSRVIAKLVLDQPLNTENANAVSRTLAIALDPVENPPEK